MRILAIRGENLASLAGPFEVELARGPLAAAGVFAIIGPTGSGKTTLLDALCVALFEKTPRLVGGSRIGIGTDIDRIGVNDPRSLVRRGASSGWAEVDFEGVDGRSYRSRWAVHRARGKATGKMQDPTLTLTRLDDGRRLGGTRQETREAVIEALGLTFEQFCRSALLAQGEFAAFLRADAAARGDLLERMTGTEIYGLVSIAAHQRASVAVAEALGLAAKRDAIPQLPDEARAALEAAGLEGARALAVARAAVGQGNEALAWLRRGQALATAEASARRDETAAHVASDALEPERQWLREHERAEAARETAQAASTALGRWRQAQGDEQQAREVVNVAHRGREDAIRGQEEAARVDDELVKLEAALEVDLLARVEVPSPRSRSRAVPSGASVSHLQAEARAVRAILPLVPRGMELVRELERVTALAQARDGWNRQAKQLAIEEQACLARQAPVAEALEAAERGLRQARANYERMSAEADGAGGVREVLRAAEARCVDAEALAQATVAAARAASDQHAAVVDLADLATAQERGREAVAAVEVELIRLEGEVAQSERAVRRLAAAAELTHHRAQLVEGEACALCGATEHPWAERGAIDDLVAASEADHAALVASQRSARDRREALTVGQRDVALGMAAAQRSVAMAAEALGVAAGDYAAQLQALGELPWAVAAETAEAAELAAQLAASASSARAQARADEARVALIERSARDARAALDQAQADRDGLAAEQARLAEAVRAARAAQLQVTTELAAASAVHREAAVGVRRTLALAPGWAAERALAAGAVGGGGEAAGGLAGGAVAAEGGGEAAGGGGEAAAFGDDADLRGLARALADQLQRWHAAASAVAQLRDRTRQRLNDAFSMAQEAANRLARAEATLAAAQQGTLREADAQVAAEASFVSACATLGRSTAEILACLRRDPREVEAVRARTASAARELANRVAVRGERVAARGAHLQEAPASSGCAALVAGRGFDDDALVREAFALEGAAVAEAARAEAAASEGVARARAALALDSQHRLARAAAEAAIASHDAASAPMRALAALIGSHDGKAFRTFAQSLTLDTLLHGANAHLAALAPRYHLMRVPHADLEIQVVDRDLGDEARATTSLSGGESFLASLALALALAQLSAKHVQVRTLLIDEGFGTLDPASLDAALAVLDSLQASGRQIGVISHVPALNERVAAHVQLKPLGGGRSAVTIRAAS